MAWNDPGKKGNNGNGQDPWGKDGGPPDLEEVIRQLQRKIASLFGGGKTRTFDIEPSHKSNFGFWLIAIILIAAYLLSGIYIVQPYELAVIKRFGGYIRTEGPGPHWVPRFIEKPIVLNVDEVKTTNHKGEMLTRDENILHAEIAVQYRISNPVDYLFNLDNPDMTIRQVSDSALRSIVGQSTLNEVLTTGRSDVTHKIRQQVETVLKNYKAGLEISDLAMQQTKAPDEVKEAFDDAIKAQQDEERYVNEAEVYANQKIPIAEGNAKRIQQEALAYKEQQILYAKGDTARFEQILPEYIRQPQVMRDRLYLDALEEVLSKTSKIMVNVEGGNNLMVLPLDQIQRKVQETIDPNLNITELTIEKPQLPDSGNTIRPARERYEDISRYRNTRGG